MTKAFFPESHISAVCYKTQDSHSLIDKKDFFGSPISMIEDTMAFLIRHMNVCADIPLRGQHLAARKDIYDYPLVALREAIVNAVTHRDYLYDGGHIYVHMYPDRVDIENPGGLYRGLELSNLGTHNVRRTRLIADLLHRAHYIDRVGSGFDRMHHALAENNNPPLEVVATNFFNIRFYKQLERQHVCELTKRQLQIYQLFERDKQLTKNAIAYSMGVSPDTVLRELQALISHELIEKQGTGRATYYQLVKK